MSNYCVRGAVLDASDNKSIKALGVQSSRRNGQNWIEVFEALLSSYSPASNCLTVLCVPIKLLYNIHSDCFKSPLSPLPPLNKELTTASQRT